MNDLQPSLPEAHIETLEDLPPVALTVDSGFDAFMGTNVGTKQLCEGYADQAARDVATYMAACVRDGSKWCGEHTVAEVTNIPSQQGIQAMCMREDVDESFAQGVATFAYWFPQLFREKLAQHIKGADTIAHIVGKGEKIPPDRAGIFLSLVSHPTNIQKQKIAVVMRVTPPTEESRRQIQAKVMAAVAEESTMPPEERTIIVRTFSGDRKMTPPVHRTEGGV